MGVKKLERVASSGPAIVGIVLSASLLTVMTVLLVLAAIKRMRRRHSASAVKSPSTDLQISVLEEGIIHPPPLLKKKAQKDPSSPFSSPDMEDGDDLTLEDNQPSPGTEHMEIEDEKENQQSHPEHGTLHFSARYNFDKNALTVTVVRYEHGFPEGKKPEPLDPYVKIQLLPDKKHRAKTRVLRNTMRPVYNEEFTFYGLTYNELQTTVLHFAVINFDRYSRDQVLGELFCPLSMIDLSKSDEEVAMVKEITMRPKVRASNRGEVLLSLCYQPATNRVTCVLLKAKGLPRKNLMDLADPYAKLYLMWNGQRIAKKKTHVQKHTLNPVFNESFIFDLPSHVDKLDNLSLELLMLDFDRLTKNEVIGRLEIGLNAADQVAKDHWEELLKNPRRQIAQWHKLTD